MAVLSLKEIVWEITAACNNGCSYCGSKEVWNSPINEEKILDIAESICRYYPPQIDISGGDPLLVSYKTHKKIISMFKEKAIICKILVNPKSFTDYNCALKILPLYDWIGVSINTKEDAELVDKIFSYPDFSPLRDRVTCITNFNKNNIFDFDVLSKSVGDNLWMIQYTMYKEGQDIDALYKNDGAVSYLKDKILNRRGFKNVILSDNINEDAMCGAGISSLGILNNGDVVPCLSLRSWKKDINKYVIGNILNSSLQQLWETSFKNCRFEDFKSCKNHCGKTISLKKEQVPWIPEHTQKNPILYNPNMNQVILYAVQQQATMVYAVTTGIITTSNSKSVSLDFLDQQR